MEIYGFKMIKDNNRLNNIDLAVDAQNENHVDDTVVAFDFYELID